MKLSNIQADQLQANQLKDEMLSILLNMPVIVDAINDKEYKAEQEALKLRLETIDSITAMDEQISTQQLEIKKLQEKAEISFSKLEKDKTEIILQEQAFNELLRSRSALWKSLHVNGEGMQSTLSSRLHGIIESERQLLTSLESEYSQIPKDIVGKAILRIRPEYIKNLNSRIYACNTKLKKLDEIFIESNALSMSRISPNKLKAKVNQLYEQLNEALAVCND